MTSLNLWRAVCLLLIFLLAACQHRPSISPSEPAANWQQDKGFFKQRQLQWAQQDFWRYSAKVAVQTNQIKEQANLVWQFASAAHTVRLFGPLGAGQVKLDFDNQQASLSGENGVIHKANSAQQLLQKVIGWTMPVDALQHWVFLLPEPGADFFYQLNPQGQLKSLRQHGWQVDYADYRDYQGQLLPRKMTAVKLQDATGQVREKTRVKLISKRWQWQH